MRHGNGPGATLCQQVVVLNLASSRSALAIIEVQLPMDGTCGHFPRMTAPSPHRCFDVTLAIAAAICLTTRSIALG